MKKKVAPKLPKKPAAIIGRPTIYKPEFCEKLIEHMKSGLSFESFGATIGVSRDRVYKWAQEHEAFAEAKARALDESLLFWEKQGNLGLWGDKEGPQFNNVVWVFSMKNRHGWRDSKDVSVQKEVKIVDELERDKIRKLSMRDLKKLVKANLPEEET